MDLQSILFQNVLSSLREWVELRVVRASELVNESDNEKVS